MKEKLDYIVVTPAYNEVLNIELTIQSMVSQTILPKVWIIVDDGSSDGTGQVASLAAQTHCWIKILRRFKNQNKNNDGLVVSSEAKAFLEGLKIALEVHPNPKFVVKLDGDLNFDPDYFTNLFKECEKDPKLGIVGGVIYEYRRKELVREKISTAHVRGATKMYRWQCYKDIGGIRPVFGWDVIDEIIARAAGWNVTSFEHVRLVHLRRTASREGRFAGWARNGYMAYYIGMSPLRMLLRSFFRLIVAHDPVQSCGLAYGYFANFLKRTKKLPDPVIRKMVRRNQWLTAQKSLYDHTFKKVEMRRFALEKEKKLQVGIIGCGIIAKDHVGAIRNKCGSIELHLCDRNLKAAEKLKKILGPEVRVYDDAFEFISENKFDIVHILTPPDSHYDLAKSALENNAHVLIEKPMTLTLKDTESLFVLAKNLGRKVCVDHSLLYMDCVQKMFNRIRSGQMGRVISAYCFFGHAEQKKTIPYGGVSHWSYNMAGGPLTNLISHPASVLVELMGMPEDIMVTNYARNLMPYGMSDVMHAVIRSARGHGEFTISMAHGSSSRYIIAECEKGSVLVDFSRQLMIPKFHKGLLGPISKKFGGIGQGFSYIGATLGVMYKILAGKMKTNPGTRRLVGKFYDAVRNDLPCPVSEENTEGVAKILDAFLEKTHSTQIV